MIVIRKSSSEKYVPKLSENEAIEKMSLERKKDFSSGRISLQRALEKYLKNWGVIFNEGDFYVHQNLKEKPKLVFLKKIEGIDFKNIDFSISHSHGNSMCFLCKNGKAGADLEKARNFNGDLLESFLDKREIRIINRKKRLRKKKAALFWSLKEAYLKAIGTGLMRNPKEVKIYKNISEKKYFIKDRGDFIKSEVKVGLFLNKFVWATIIVL